MQILARNKYKIKGFNPNSLFILLFGALVSWLGWIANSNIFVAVTFLVVSIFAFIVAISKSRKQVIEISESKLMIDNFSIPLENCINWVMIEMENDLEFFIKTTDFVQQTQSFYISKTETSLKKFIEALNLSIPYSQELSKEQFFNEFLRYIGIR